MRILLMGRKQACADALTCFIEDGHTVVAVVTDHHLDGSPTTQAARLRDIPTLTLENAERQVRAGDLTFDLGISIVFWQRIKPVLIDASTLGIINFHPAPLPGYKGTGGYNLAILEARDTWAVTAHYVDEDFDTGKIISVDEFPIDRDRETAQSLESKSMQHLFDLAVTTVRSVANCNGVLPASANVGGRYVSRRQMEDLKMVVEGDDVDRKIRAFWFPPYSGATITCEGKKFTLVNEQILAQLSPDGTNLQSPAAVRTERLKRLP